MNGRIEIHTGDGSIRANDIAGELTLSTGDGSITVDGAEGRLTLDTGDGGVNVAGKLTGVKLHTGDGSIVYRAQPGTAMAEDWDITTGDGGVSIYLPADFGAELDAHTGDGTIRNDLDVAAERVRPKSAAARCADASEPAAGNFASGQATGRSGCGPCRITNH